MSFFANIMDIVRTGGNWLLILVFLGAGFGYGMVMGRNRLNLIALGGYFSFVIVKFLPWKELGFLNVGEVPDSNIQIFLFLAIILGIYFYAPHSAFGSVAKIHGRGKGSLWQLVILGILQLGFLASVVFSFLPAKTFADINPIFKQFFADDLFRFLWLLLPILAMFILKKRKTYSYGDED